MQSYCLAYPFHLHVHFSENEVHCHFTKSFNLTVKCIALFSDFFLSDNTNITDHTNQVLLAVFLCHDMLRVSKKFCAPSTQKVSFTMNVIDNTTV
jgi:hypothetical protein